jgi:hypothetical protein
MKKIVRCDILLMSFWKMGGRHEGGHDEWV